MSYFCCSWNKACSEPAPTAPQSKGGCLGLSAEAACPAVKDPEFPLIGVLSLLRTTPETYAARASMGDQLDVKLPIGLGVGK